MSLEIHLSDEQLDELADRVAERLCEPEPDRWLNTGEAAEYLGVHPVTLRKWAAERKVPLQQDCNGCSLRFLRSDLDSWRRGGVDRGGTMSPRRNRGGAAGTARPMTTRRHP